MKERFRVLVRSGIVLFACYYSYDIPSALNRYLVMDGKAFDTSRITYLYAAYAMPNIVCPFIIGHYIQSRKPRLPHYLCLIILAGQALFSLGLSIQSYVLMVIGRLVHGLGGEGFSFVQSRTITLHFRDKELALSMACFSGLGRLGTISNFILTPFIAEKAGGFVASLTGVAITLASVIGYWLISAKSALKYMEEEIEEYRADFVETNAGTPQRQEACTQEQEAWCAGPGCVAYGDSALNAGGDTETLCSHRENALQGASLESYRKLRESSRVELLCEDDTIFARHTDRDATFHPAFRVFLGMVFLFSVVWAPFYNVAPMLFQKKYSVGNKESGKMVAMIEGVSMALVSLTSVFSDFIGYKLLMMLFGGMLLTLSHVLIYTSAGSALLVVFLLGFASPLISCYGLCMPLLVSEEKIGLGFAILSCISNFSYTFSPIMVSLVFSLRRSFDDAEFFFIAVSVLSTILTVVLLFYNRYYNLGMNRPERK